MSGNSCIRFHGDCVGELRFVLITESILIISGIDERKAKDIITYHCSKCQKVHGPGKGSFT